MAVTCLHPDLPVILHYGTSREGLPWHRVHAVAIARLHADQRRPITSCSSPLDSQRVKPSGPSCMAWHPALCTKDLVMTAAVL